MEWSRPFNDILQISWPFLSKIVSMLKKPQPILRSREEYPNDGSDDDTSNVDKREPSNNVDDMKAWGSANEHLLECFEIDTNSCSAKCIAAI